LTGRNAREAFGDFVAPLREALGCITHQRLTLPLRTSLTVNASYAVTLGGMDPVRLGGAVPVLLRFGQQVRIRSVDPNDPRGPCEVHLTQYLYAFSTADDREVLAFHWTPEARERGAVTTPHLHIGPALTAGQTVIRPGDLHKVHVPTGLVSIEAVIRLALTEFGVRPLRRNGEHILRRTENAPHQSQTQ
jgi:hypothetical protein